MKYCEEVPDQAPLFVMEENMGRRLYECDPRLNTKCHKTGCQDYCFHTSHVEFAKSPRAYEVAEDLTLVEVKEEKPKKKTTAKKK